MKTIFIIAGELSRFETVNPDINDIFPYVGVISCKHSKKEVLAIFIRNEEPLCLHNGEFCSVEDEIVAVDLFNNKDVDFLEKVDFFTSKNSRIKNPLINIF